MTRLKDGRARGEGDTALNKSFNKLKGRDTPYVTMIGN